MAKFPQRMSASRRRRRYEVFSTEYSSVFTTVFTLNTASQSSGVYTQQLLRNAEYLHRVACV